MARRRRTLLVLCVAAMLVVPAAISWACNPARTLQVDRDSYFPGQTVNVRGEQFKPDAPVTIRIDGEPVASTTTSSIGSISVSFAAPAKPGTYALTSVGVDPETGNSLPGTGTPESLIVKAPAPAPSAPAQGGGPGADTPAPGATVGPGTSSPTGNSRTTSGREPSRAERRRSTADRGPSADRGSSGAASGARTGGANTAEGVIRTAGRAAFAGSVSRRQRTVAAKEGGTSKANPSRRAATADLWDGFASERNPSLLPSTRDGGVPSAGTPGGVLLAVGLLGVGLLGLLGLVGLTAAGARKRRSTARSR